METRREVVEPTPTVARHRTQATTLALWTPILLALALAALLSPAASVLAQTVTATVPVGNLPHGVGVNPTTGRVYVANNNSNTVSVIDGATNAVVATVPVGNGPELVGVNPTTGRVYVTNRDSNSVSVIDGVTNAVVATIPLPIATNPNGLAVNPTTGRVYTANYGKDTVSVIDGATNAVVATVPVGNAPVRVAVNPTTSRVYVTNINGNSVSVIDGTTNAVVATIASVQLPYGVGVNPTRSRVYVANLGNNTVTVIDAATNTVVATVPVGTNPYGVGVNPTTSHVYAANETSNDVSVIEDLPPIDPTSTTLSCAPASVMVGTSTTCTATVSNVTTPTGAVSFSSSGVGSLGGNPCTLSGSGSSASCSVSYTPSAVGPGSHTITATYAGDSAHTGSSGSAAVTVTPRPTSTVVTCSPNSIQAGGGTTTCTGTVTDTAAGTPSAPQVTITFSSSNGSGTFAGNPCTLTPLTGNTQSSCQVTYSATKASTDTITATYNGDDGVHGGSSGTTAVTIKPGPPANVTVAPATQTQAVDTTSCVTGTVTDAFGNPISGVMVNFSVTGVNMASGSSTTNANGQATFCYVGRLFGTDTVRASVNSSAPFGTATVIWTLPVTTPLCAVDITNGGWVIANDGDKASFGGNASSDQAGSPRGQEQYTDSPANLDVHSINVQAIVCGSNMEKAEILGQATINGSGQHAYRIDVSDPDSTGGSDTYGILLDTGYDSGIHPLGGGHVEIHKSS
jgi:YVTN family beta-propeller protein